MTQDIYISKWLEKNYKVVYDQLSTALLEVNSSPKVLPYSNEVWCRDYMPSISEDEAMSAFISVRIIFGILPNIRNTSLDRDWP